MEASDVRAAFLLRAAHVMARRSKVVARMLGAEFRETAAVELLDETSLAARRLCVRCGAVLVVGEVAKVASTVWRGQRCLRVACEMCAGVSYVRLKALGKGNFTHAKSEAKVEAARRRKAKRLERKRTRDGSAQQRHRPNKKVRLKDRVYLQAKDAVGIRADPKAVKRSGSLFYQMQAAGAAGAGVGSGAAEVKGEEVRSEVKRKKEKKKKKKRQESVEVHAEPVKVVQQKASVPISSLVRKVGVDSAAMKLIKKRQAGGAHASLSTGAAQQTGVASKKKSKKKKGKKGQPAKKPAGSTASLYNLFHSFSNGS